MARRRQQARTRTRRSRSAGAGDAASLPALSRLSDTPAFAELRATPDQLRAFDDAVAAAVAAGASDNELSLGCVVRLDRGFPAVACADELLRAEFSAALSKDRSSRVAIGDWVMLRRTDSHEMGVVEAILPRKSDIARWRGGSRGERQTLAANVDLVFVVQSLSERGIDVDRIARSVVVALDCGAKAAVVLTKADRVPSATDLADGVRLVRQALGERMPVVVSCAAVDRDEGAADAPVAELREAALGAGALWGRNGVLSLAPEGIVAIMLGESGAGKSTLLNALLGRPVLETGAVRESDDAGRHTTVARRMVSLPGAGVIVDEPGLRSLPLVGHERGLAKAFPDIADAAVACRFRDCTHTHEPGCAVREALAEGEFAAAALDEYISLASEMRDAAGTIDPDVAL